MIVGCYTMDLYCEVHYSENEMEKVYAFAKRNLMYRHNKVHQFTGPTEANCNKQARADGWKLDLKTGQCWCPIHRQGF